MKAQKITVAEVNGEVVASAEDAKATDVVTTLFSTEQAVTGFPKFIQLGSAVALGMGVQQYRNNGSFNFIRTGSRR